MKTLLKLCILVGPLLFFSGCCKTDVPAGHNHPHSEVTAQAGDSLCGKCGEIKGSDKCCDQDAQKCGC